MLDCLSAQSAGNAVGKVKLLAQGNTVVGQGSNLSWWNGRHSYYLLSHAAAYTSSIPGSVSVVSCTRRRGWSSNLWLGRKSPNRHSTSASWHYLDFRTDAEHTGTAAGAEMEPMDTSEQPMMQRQCGISGPPMGSTQWKSGSWGGVPSATNVDFTCKPCAQTCW